MYISEIWYVYNHKLPQIWLDNKFLVDIIFRCVRTFGSIFSIFLISIFFQLYLSRFLTEPPKIKNSNKIMDVTYSKYNIDPIRWAI